MEILIILPFMIASLWANDALDSHATKETEQRQQQFKCEKEKVVNNLRK